MKRLIFVNLLLFIGLVSFSQPNYDSLYSEVANLHGQEKLDAYYNFYLQHYREHTSAEPIFNFLNHYREEAQRQQSIEDESYSWMTYCKTLYDFQMFDAFLENRSKTLNILKKNNSMRLYYELFSTYIEYFVMKGKYQTAIMESEQLYNEVKNTDDYHGLGIATYSLGFTYAAMDDYGKAESYFREAATFFEKMPVKTIGINLNLAYDRLAEMLKIEKKYSEMIEMCDKGKDVSIRYLKENNLESDSIYSLVYINMNFAYAYIGINQLDKALHYIDLVRQGSQGYVYAEMNLYSLESEYYSALGDYEKARDMMQQVIEYQEMMGSDNLVLAEKKGDLAELMFKTGNYIEAYTLFKDYHHVTDSVRSLEFKTSLDEFSSIYELDKISAKHERLMMQTYFYFAIILLLIIILAIIIYYYRLSAKKNKALYKKIHERVMENRTKINDLIKPVDEPQLHDFIENIEQTIIENGLFQGVNVSRKTVADQLSVSEKYVNDAIRVMTNQNYFEYLNELRLQRACRLIMEKPEYTFDAIAFESGFNSRATFFRVFADTYGMSPGEFKKLNNRSE